MFADTVTQTKCVVKPARIIRCKVLDAVCVLPASVLQDLVDWENAVEQARDKFIEASRVLSDESFTSAVRADQFAESFDYLRNVIITLHSKQLQAVQQYGVDAI